MKEKILLMFRDLYCKEYIGKLIIKLFDGGYTLILGLNNIERPIVISALMDEDDFLNLVKEELRTRRLDMTEYYDGYKIYPTNDRFLQDGW